MKIKSALLINNVSSKARSYKKQILKAVSDVIDEGIYFNGQKNTLLTKHLESFLGTQYLTLCGSGHDALMLAVSALQLAPDDEVIFPVNSYPTAFPVALSGVKPVPVDVDENGQLDPEKLMKAITKKTKAVIIVHMYGQVGNLKAVTQIAKKNKLILIEDCAQSFGTQYSGQMTGTFGDIACFSFYPTKNLGALGDGGAVTTNKKSFHRYFQQAVSYGEKSRYNSEFISFHSRVPSIQAAILDLYLKDIKKEFKRRKELFRELSRKLSPLVKTGKISVIHSSDEANPVPHLFVIKIAQRNKLQNFLKEHKVETLIHYPQPVHLVKAFSYLGYKPSNFSVAEKLSKQILSLPFHSSLRSSDLEYMIEQINSFFS